MKHAGYSLVWEHALHGRYDGRTRLVKAMNTLRNRLISDLGGEPSTQESILLDRAVVKTFRLLTLETAMMEGKADKAEGFYISLSNSLRLDLQTLGLQRKQKNITDLTTYLKETYGDDPNNHPSD